MNQYCNEPILPELVKTNAILTCRLSKKRKYDCSQENSEDEASVSRTCGKCMLECA